MRTRDDLGGLEDVRPDDVLTFLRVYRRAKEGSLADRKTFFQLFDSKEAGEAHSTVIGRLQRIADFVARIRPLDAAPGQQIRSGLDLLFAYGDDRGLRPTEAADALHREFVILKDVYRKVRSRVREELGKPQSAKKVRVGVGHNIGMHLLPYIFSNWNGMFGTTLRASVEIGNTLDLVLRLNAGLLDFVVTYGSENSAGVQHPELHIAFTSFGYESRMVLTCHPLAQLWLTNGSDVNVGYWESYYKAYNPPNNSTTFAAEKSTTTVKMAKHQTEETAERPPRYPDLRPVDLEGIDYGRTKLIVARSWDQPPILNEVVSRLANRDALLLVNSYDEALARVRAGLGVAVVPEVFCKRHLITAFRLVSMPGDSPSGYTRFIGVNYSTRYHLFPEAVYLMEFVRAYVEQYHWTIRNGRPAAIDRPDFVQWSKEYRLEKDWKLLAEEQYPMEKKRTRRRKV